jgi:gamma-glutamyl-gamma-aminobutyrate hydrolase PuuD
MDSIEIAGGRPRLIEEKKLPADATALVVMGGVDVDPKLYGAKRGPHTDRPHKERDEHEMALLQHALERDIPVLAICRGHQLLNVTLGGSLLQHIEGDGHKWTADGDSSWHEIEVTEPGSRLARAYGGATTLRVNSRHHQGVTKERLAGDLRPVAASHDAFVEAVESTAHKWVMGVQWHPERPEMRPEAAPLFAALVEAASGK